MNSTNCIILHSILHILLSNYATASNEKPYNAIEEPYSAELLNYNKFAPKNKYKSKVSVSKHGVKIRSKGMFHDEAQGVYIQNFHSKNSWVIDTKSKIFSLINEPQEEASGESESRMGGIMATHPCTGYKDAEKKMENEKTLTNDSITIWSCHLNNKTIKQGYSQRWKIIVWEEHPNGNISELINIKKNNFGKD